MQIIKRSFVILTCIVVLLSSFCLNGYAYSADYYDMLADGWVYDSDTDSYFIPYSPSYSSPVMSLTLEEPIYPLFEPNDISWSEMPTYIQDIVYASFTPFVEQGTYKIPFVCVAKTDTFVRVFCGWNVSIGRLSLYTASSNTTEFLSLGLFAFPNLSDSYGNSVLYCADFTLNNLETPAIPWRAVTPQAYGTTGNIVQYGGFGVPTTSSYDLYFYGSNFARSGATSVSVYATPSTNSSGASIDHYSVRVIQDPVSGFASGTFVFRPADFASSYFGYFSPKTIEQQQASTSKGIWQTLKELPSTLMEKIEGFFNNFLNYILYFQADKPEHVNPFANILDGIQSFFDGQMNDVTDFKNSLNSTLENVVTYIESGSGVINTFLTAVPLLSAFVTFFVVFCIIRKVIGR